MTAFRSQNYCLRPVMTDGQVGMSMASRWAKAPVAGFPVKIGSSSAVEMAIEAGAWGRTGTGWPRGDDLGGQVSQPAWCPASGGYAPVTTYIGHRSPISASS